MSKLKPGWQVYLTPGSRKAHYFAKSKCDSLCGRIGFYFAARENPNTYGNPDDCTKCTDLLKKRLAAKAIKEASKILILLPAILMLAGCATGQHTFVDRTNGAAVVVGPGEYRQYGDGTLTQISKTPPSMPVIVGADTMSWIGKAQ